ncbi:MAG: hypothetical protein HY720_03000 [Planctomycetes bacterium]|nr:hypothetical protein [Planctomycetota bacterium]
MSALSVLARHFRETAGGGEPRSELQRFLSAMAMGGAKRSAELLGQRNPEEAYHWATIALLALEGLHAPPENLDINIFGARSTAAHNLGRYAEAAGDLERSLRANPALARRGPENRGAATLRGP